MRKGTVEVSAAEVTLINALLFSLPQLNGDDTVGRALLRLMMVDDAGPQAIADLMLKFAKAHDDLCDCGQSYMEPTVEMVEMFNAGVQHNRARYN
jgi:hypothetical protein